MVIFPIMARVILDGIVQVPNGAAGGANQILHGAIFQKGGLKSALAKFAAVHIGRPRSAGPDLRDIAVTSAQARETGFGTDNPPLRVVDETMGGNVTTHMAAGALVIILKKIEHLLQGAAIEKVF